MKVYLLEKGKYSDYRILGVFSDKEKAEKVAEKIWANVSEPFNLDEFGCDQTPEGMKCFAIEMCKDGKITNEDWCEQSVLDSKGKKWVEGHYWETYQYLKERGREAGFRRSHWRLRVRCYAKDKQHAIKIANEKRAMALAGNLDQGDPAVTYGDY